MSVSVLSGIPDKSRRNATTGAFEMISNAAAAIWWEVKQVARRGTIPDGSVPSISEASPCRNGGDVG
jgi:hypothetical protein